MNRNEIVKRANEAGRLSNRGGAPTLAPDSDGPTVVEWLQWADPNGIHTWHDACGSRDCEYCGRRGEPHYPADGDPWGAVAEMLADTLPCCPACESDDVTTWAADGESATADFAECLDCHHQWAL